MKISTKTRYGVQAMVDLALHTGTKPVLVKEIARRQRVSERYLEHLMLTMKKAGFIRSQVGAKGGYFLARDPAKITVREIVEVFEGSLAPVDCAHAASSCPRSAVCATREVWCSVRDTLARLLDATTVASLVRRHQEKEAGSAAMYEI